MRFKKTDTLMQEISKRIKIFRGDKGWSLDILARKTGFTKSYLSQIENSKKEPPISSLIKIARALSVDLIALITGEKVEIENKPFILVRANERKLVTPLQGSESYKFESLTYKRATKLMDAYILTASFEFPKNPLIHEGEEFIFMLEGKQEVFYDGKRYFVEAGDCFYIDSNRPHYGKSIGEIPAKFIVVSCLKKETH
jgi:transcriptional regulator with XRE-family HTH domain